MYITDRGYNILVLFEAPELQEMPRTPLASPPSQSTKAGASLCECRKGDSSDDCQYKGEHGGTFTLRFTGLGLRARDEGLGSGFRGSKSQSHVHA